MSRPLVLMYHALSSPGVYTGDRMDRADRRYLLPADLLSEQVSALLASGRMPPRWGEAHPLEAVRESNGLLLTFDDSWKSHASVALPLLKEMGYAGLFFLTVNQLGRSGMLTEEDVKAMRCAGASIGSHGMTHRHFDILNRRELQAELSDSRKALSDLLGEDITVMALPGGKTHRRLLDLAQEAGYEHILGSRPGLWAPDDILVPRLVMTPDLNGKELMRLVENPLAFCARKCIRYRMLLFLRMILGAHGYQLLRRAVLRD